MASRASASPAAGPIRGWPRGWWLPVVIALAALAYRPVFSAGLVWDDDAHLTAEHLRPPAGLARIWAEPGATQQYYPLLHSWFWIQSQLWGDQPAGYHAVNLALHLLVAFLVWRVLAHLAVRGAGLAAALFLLHPLQVETAAWISEQKNTLSAALALGAVLAWLKFDDSRRRGWWWLGFGLFAAGLAAKTAIGPVAPVLLVLAWWRRGRLDARRDVGPLIPWCALAVGAGLFTAAVERHLIGASGADFALSPIERLLVAGRVPWFYLRQMLWPTDLTFIYPRWTIDPAAVGPWLVLALSVGVTATLAARRHHLRGAWAAWVAFGGLLFPALGFFNVYPFRYSFVADHFAYLATIPVFALIAAVLTPTLVHRVAFAAIVLPVLALLSWRQASTFRDAATLYRATLGRNPQAWLAWNNLGRELLREPARPTEAIRCFQRAVALHPDYFEARNNLGLVLSQLGRPHEALPHLGRAVQLQPASYQVHNNLGIALVSAGHVRDSLIAFRTAVALSPGLPNARENLGRALRLAGYAAEAEAQFAAADRLRGSPRFAGP